MLHNQTWSRNGSCHGDRRNRYRRSASNCGSSTSSGRHQVGHIARIVRIRMDGGGARSGVDDDFVAGLGVLYRFVCTIVLTILTQVLIVLGHAQGVSGRGVQVQIRTMELALDTIEALR